MSESEWDTIYQNLSLKDTEELIGYWQKHAEDEWMPIAFEAMEKILIERLGELPIKDEIEMTISTNPKQEEKTNAFTDLGILITDNDTVFYDPQKVTALIKWIYRSVNILIGLYIIQFIFNNSSLFRAMFEQKYQFSSLVYTLVSSVAGLLFVIVMLFIEYKVLGYVLKALREMEINSRKTIK